MMHYSMPKHIGDYNKNQVLSILRERGPTSRVELSRILRISPTAITRNTAQLLNIGIIREGSTEDSSMGRKPVSVELCSDFCYVLGADIVGGSLKVVLADLMGNFLQYYEEPVSQGNGAYGVMEQLLFALKKVVNESGIPSEKIWVITIGSPGIFDPTTRKSQHTFFWDNWEDIDIRSRVFEALSIETVIENDVNLDVIGESWKGVGIDYENILYVKLGQGLGARSVLQGNLFKGEHEMAGEISYMMPGLPRDPDDKQHADYEHLLSNATFCKRYQEMTGKNTAATISDLCALASVGDDAAKALVDDLLAQFAVVLLNCSTLLDPQVIILGGDACCFGDKELAVLKQRIERYLPVAQNILTSKLNKKACLYGAIKLGLDRVEERITAIW